MNSIFQHRSMRRSLLLLGLLMGCSSANTNELYAVVGCIPVVGSLLIPDAGLASTGFRDAGPVDAAGIFDDAGIPIFPSDTVCNSSGQCETGTTCVQAGGSQGHCLRPCNGNCTGVDRACQDLAGASYCVPVASRGEPCDRAACRASDGLTCLPARVEGSSVLAWTCQRQCDRSQAGSCATGEDCLPNGTGQWELQGGGAPVACVAAQCAAGVDGGTCPCSSGFGCVDTGAQGVACARLAGVCGAPASPGDPALLGTPTAWDVASTCDPGSAQRFCQGVDGGAPVLCVQGSSPERVVTVAGVTESLPGVSGLCTVVCRDPVLGAAWPCPGTMQCKESPGVLFHVTAPDAGCAATEQCNVAAGEECVGPLAAYAFGYRCAVPYGVCRPM